MNGARAYWAGRYSEQDAIKHHSDQNRAITRDFLQAVEWGGPIHATLRGAKSILEVGCGTGELAAEILDRFHPVWLLATDASAEAVAAGRERHPEVPFAACALENAQILDLGARVDLVICSNTLEHFRKPHQAIKAMFTVGRQLLLLVPYRQPVTDSYDGEGGAGHVSKFSLTSFRRYRIVDSVVFATEGWTYSSKGETPKQLAVLLEAK